MNFQRLAEPAHASHFDIDDAAGSRFHCCGRDPRINNRLIQADGGSQFLLQPRMIVDVVIPQRLLDHQQVELVEIAQVLHLVKGVGRVRIAAQGDIRPTRANAFQHVHVPPRFHLHLNPAISRRQFRLYLAQQLFD